jgi:hypothetical protein
LENCILLVAARFVNTHMDWYLLNNLILSETASHFQHQIDSLIKSIGKYSLNICEAFGIPQHVIYAPIYTGYQEYYKEDKTGGEHKINLRPKF